MKDFFNYLIIECLFFQTKDAVMIFLSVMMWLCLIALVLIFTCFDVIYQYICI